MKTETEKPEIISFHFKFETWVQRIEVTLNDELFKEMQDYGRCDLLMGLLEHVRNKMSYNNDILDSYNKFELLTEKILTIEPNDFVTVFNWFNYNIERVSAHYKKTQLGTLILLQISNPPFKILSKNEEKE